MEGERRLEACEGDDGVDGRNDAIVAPPPPTSNAATAFHPAVNFPGSLQVRG